MGIIAGTATFTRFLVIGQPPVSQQDQYIEAIRANAFWDIENTDAERSMGWVEYNDFTSTAFEPAEQTFLADLVLLTLRMDKRAIPPTIRKLYLSREEKEYRRKTGRKALAKSEREEIKEKVEKDLLRKILPTPSLYEVIWNTLNGWVFLGTTSQAVISEFVELFHKTFGLELRLAHPYALGEAAKLDEQSAEEWAEVQPAVFSMSAKDDEEPAHE